MDRGYEQRVAERCAILPVVQDFNRDFFFCFDGGTNLCDSFLTGLRPLKKTAIAPHNLRNHIACHIRNAWLANTIGLSGWFGSVRIIGIRVVSIAEKKISLL